jgi:pimeloyl-[acyl-carrier protein] methyl ester esterase
MSALRVEASGSGPPLVLWHGWGSNLRIFDTLCERWRAEHTLHAVDLPGYGRNAAVAELDDDATLAALIDTLPEDAVLLGWSLGGQWALRAALAQPSYLRALVLVHTTPQFLATPGWPHGIAPAVLKQFADQLQQDQAQCLHDFLELQLRGSRGAAPAISVLLHSLLQHGVASRAQLQRDLERLATLDLRAQLAAIRTPALVVSGQHDRVTPPSAAEQLAGALGTPYTVRLARAGHCSFLSHPEAFDAALRDFLATLPATRA